jgi:hypothetical protein
MKAIYNALRYAIFTVLVGLTYQCSGTKEIASTNFEQHVPFKIKSVYFQEWFAGIDHGGTGYTLYLPVVQKGANVTVEDVYFRNLRGRFYLQDGRYIAILKNPNKSYVFTKPQKPENYPFDLRDNECVVSYIEDGATKFYKLKIDEELAGVYYKDGAPSIYTRMEHSTMATLDIEED